MTVRRRVGQALRRIRSGTHTPRLSVIVPTYNVEQYLPECLDSILAQTFRDFEVVVVDDGSTDSSGAVAADYARRHQALRVITSVNQGLGAARNLGVSEARGELLAFVDSDDSIPPEAYEVMLRALDESGSDFVVGSVKRHRPDGELFHPPWLRTLHRERRLGLVARDFPEILADVFAWNKVFRRDFWERQQLAFPVGIRYEDQVLTTEAYLTARSFDVVRMPVYFWRVRDDGTSITQRRHEVDDLRDRIDTKRTSLQLVRDMGTPDLNRVFYNFVLCMDLPSYFQELPGANDEYWELLHRGVAELWSAAPPFSDAAMPVHYRLVAWLVLNDRREQADAVATVVEQHRPDIPLRFRGDHVVADLPYLDDGSAEIPPDLYRLRDREIPWEVELTDIAVDTASLTIAGRVGIGRTADLPEVGDLSVVLRADERADIPLSVEQADAPGAFVARLQVERLLDADHGERTTWTVQVHAEVGEIARTGGFNRHAGSLPAPGEPCASIGDLEAWFTPAGGLHVACRAVAGSRPGQPAVTERSAPR